MKIQREIKMLIRSVFLVGLKWERGSVDTIAQFCWLWSYMFLFLSMFKFLSLFCRKFPKIANVLPSSNTCPKWLPHEAHTASIRFMPYELSSMWCTLDLDDDDDCESSESIVSLNDGQPEPDSNLCRDEKIASSHTMHANEPASFSSSTMSPLHGLSVPFSCVTWYCIGVSMSRSFASSNTFLYFYSLHSSNCHWMQDFPKATTTTKVHQVLRCCVESARQLSRCVWRPSAASSKWRCFWQDACKDAC